jgi:protein O-GlcNAc transferase
MSNNQPSLTQEQIDSVVALFTNGQFQEVIDTIKILNESYPNVPLLFNIIGASYKALGQLSGAIQMFENAVAIKPDYSEAHKNLGISLKDLGRLDAAVISFKKSITLEPNNVDTHYNLAVTLKAMNHLDSAVKSYEKVVSIKPDFAAAHNNLGNIFKDLGQFDDALKSYKKVIAINPNSPESYNNLGNAFKELNQLNDAVKSYKKAIAINPDFAEAHNNLGNAFKDLERLDDAVNNYEKAISINQNFAEAYFNLGIVLKQLRQLDQAVIAHEKAIAIKPDFAEAHNNLGNCFTVLGQMDAATDSYEKAIAIKPGLAEAHYFLGFNFFTLGRIKEAAKLFENAINIKPDYAQAHAKLGNIFKKLKQFDKAMLCYERAYEIKPDMNFILGDILNNKLNLCDWTGLASLLNEAKKKIVNNEKAIGPFSLLSLLDDPALQRKASETFAKFYYPKSHALPKLELYSRHKKIRIGYFSADFKVHPVATLTAELYEMHDRNNFEIHAFSFGPDTNDELNLRIKAGVDHFHDVQLTSYKEIALLARSFEIDIAVDLGGYTAKSKTDVFALSAAPIQLSYIGYLGTMGANYYDYLIADQIMIPKKSQKYYSEKIVYLPSFQVNDSKESPPELTLTRKDLRLPDKGFVFCCFNNTYKFSPTTFDSWGRILKKVKGSVLIIYANNKPSQINLTKEIALRGVDPSRLIFGERVARPEYLARYRVADLFLDTLPYNAGTTASDALRMGLPVLTCQGNSYPSRMAASIINAVNLPELITTTPEQYESLAIELATDPDKYKIIKNKLVSNLSSAPLYDTPMFTRNLESAFTSMYERYLKKQKPDHIYV